MTGTTEDRARYCEAWAQMMVDIWIEKANQYGIHIGDFVESFMYDVRERANGEIDKIVHVYNYYGRFTDMGVGNGIPYEKVSGSSRKEKPWHTETYRRSVSVLTNKMAELYGQEFFGYVSDSFGSTTTKRY